MIRTVSLMLAALALAASPAAAQRDFSKVEVKAEKVAGNVWMLTGAGGNIGVSAGPDGLLIVDDQFAPLADKIKAALKGLAPDRKLAFVLNTHWHGDHVGGNQIFGKEATIIAQENVRTRMATKQVRGDETMEASPKEALPIITYDEGLTVWYNGEEIQVLHVPHGHTDGDAIVFFNGSNVVHMGDQFFNGTFPFIDVDSGGDLVGYIKNVADVIGKIPAGAKIIAGHGPPVASIDDLKKFHAALVKTTDIVRAEIAKGMSLEDAKKAGLPEEYKSMASSFITTETWVETVYAALTKK